MCLHLVIPRNNRRVARRGRTAVARPGIRRGALLLRLVLLLVVLLLGRAGGTRTVAAAVGAVVHVALRLGLGVGALLGLVALRGLAVPAVVHKDVDAAVLRVLREVLVVVVVGRLGVFGDDVPGVDEAGELRESGGVSKGWFERVWWGEEE